MAAFVNDDFNAATNYFERCIEQSPDMNAIPLVSCYGHLRRLELAARFITGLRLAGL